MHFCGIVIKHKEVSVVDARKVLGEELVKLNLSDWYSIDDYRERVFANGKKVIPFSEFKEIWEKEFLEDSGDSVWPIAVVDEDLYIEDSLIPKGFWEFYRIEDYWKRLDALYREAYEKWVKELFNDADYNDYEVVLLDYHD